MRAGSARNVSESIEAQRQVALREEAQLEHVDLPGATHRVERGFSGLFFARDWGSPPRGLQRSKSSRNGCANAGASQASGARTASANRMPNNAVAEPRLG